MASTPAYQAQSTRSTESQLKRRLSKARQGSKGQPAEAAPAAAEQQPQPQQQPQADWWNQYAGPLPKKEHDTRLTVLGEVEGAAALPSSTYRESYVPKPCTNELVKAPRQVVPAWAYAGDFKGSSTNREDFNGHWKPEVRKAVNLSTKLTTSKAPFEGESTSRGDFVPHPIEPAEKIDPRKNDQLKFEWRDFAPYESTMRHEIKAVEGFHNPIVKPKRQPVPAWAYSGAFEGSSTSREGFKGHWKPEVRKAVNLSTKLTTSKAPFEGESTSRGDFVPYGKVEAPKIIDGRSRDQLKFEWRDFAPSVSTMGHDFVSPSPQQPKACLQKKN
jgi:hypothetical protein